ncbi:MAG TPA: hypothetical protein VIH57_23165, partial [Bacteroidales bacterium]
MKKILLYLSLALLNPAVNILGQITNVTISPSNPSVTCSYSTDGSLTATVTGGIAPFTYRLLDDNFIILQTAVDPLASHTFIGLGPGKYRIDVTDNTGDDYVTPSATTITAPSALTSGTTSPTNQTICSGSIPAPLIGTAATGETGSYTYQWYSGATLVATGQNFSPPALSVTTIYYRKVTDTNCPLSAASAPNDTITVNSSPTSGGGISLATTNICNGTAPGNFTSSPDASGGSPTPQYQWYLTTNLAAVQGDGNWTAIPGANSNTLNYTTALTVSTKFIRVYSNSCASSYSNIITVTVYAPLTKPTIAYVTPSNYIVCYSSSTGTDSPTPSALKLQTNAGGGRGIATDWLYTWQKCTDSIAGAWTNLTAPTSSPSNYSPPSNLSSTTIYRIFAHNTYCSQDKYDTLRILVSSFTVNTAVKKALTCNGGSDAILTMNYSGVTHGTISYAWKNSSGTVLSPTQDYSGVSQGTYYGYISDEVCTSSKTENFKRPPITDSIPPALTSTATFQNTCNSPINGSITITASGTNPGWGAPYQYGYSTTLTPTYSSSGTISLLPSGTYHTWIKDKKGCEIQGSDVTIGTYPDATVFNMTPAAGPYCSTPGVTFGLDGSQTTVNYQLYKDGVAVGSSVAGTGSAISFPAQTATGTYTVTATTSNGCIKNMTGSLIILASPSQPSVITPSKNPVCQGDNNITYSVTNDPTVTYSWSYT